MHIWDMEHELGVCKVCKLFEGGLTTDCSGEVSVHLSQEIYNGKLDYRKGLGWVQKLNPTNQWWLEGKIIDMEMEREKAPTSKEEIMKMFNVDIETYKEIENRMRE